MVIDTLLHRTSFRMHKPHDHSQGFLYNSFQTMANSLNVMRLQGIVVDVFMIVHEMFCFSLFFFMNRASMIPCMLVS